MSRTDLDTALNEIGRIGRYQVFIHFLLFIPFAVAGTFILSYVFIAAELPYRCRVDECDSTNNPNGEYSPDWIRNAVPFDEESNKPETCYKYKLTQSNLTDLRCAASDFDRVKIKCNEFIYDSDKLSIMIDFDLHCDENKWKLALVGTIHNCGNFVHLLIIGFVSDKYGRRIIIVASVLISCTLGILRSFAWDYPSYMFLEFIQPCLGAGSYTAGLILAMETVKPQHRAICSALLFSFMSIGKVYLGITAMVYQDWRTILRANLPIGYVAIAYYWLLPESIRWLLSHGKHEEASKSLLKIARINKTEISAELRELLENRPQDLVLNVNETTEKNESKSKENKFMLIFKYPKMMLRVAACTFCWFVNLLVFYGLSLMAVSIGGNKFTDFILVQFIEIPAAFIMPFIANRFGRKRIMLGSFIICGTAVIVYTFIGDIYGLKLALFLLGKFSIAVAMSNIYLFDSELFPTNIRHTLLGICSGVGRIGAIVAPQAPLLNFYVKNLSMYIFGGAALIAAFVVLYFPETRGTKLPDTIEEALNIGKDKKELNNKS